MPPRRELRAQTGLETLPTAEQRNFKTDATHLDLRTSCGGLAIPRIFLFDRSGGGD